MGHRGAHVGGVHTEGCTLMAQGKGGVGAHAGGAERGVGLEWELLGFVGFVSGVSGQCASIAAGTEKLRSGEAGMGVDGCDPSAAEGSCIATSDTCTSPSKPPLSRQPETAAPASLSISCALGMLSGHEVAPSLSVSAWSVVSAAHDTCSEPAAANPLSTSLGAVRLRRLPIRSKEKFLEREKLRARVVICHRRRHGSAKMAEPMIVII